MVPFLAALTMALFCRAVAPPRRRLSARLGPYLSLSRARVGGGASDASALWLIDADDRPVWRRVLKPSPHGAVRTGGSLIDADDDEALRRRLRCAGLSAIDPLQYRIRQLALAVGGLTLGATLGVVLLGSVAGTLFLMAAFGFPASTIQRNRVDRALQSRRERMRSEVYTVSQLIAVRLRTGHGPVESIRTVASTCSGHVSEELEEALAWMSSGVRPQDAYARLAADTPEPAAARLYRLVGASADSGGDIGAALVAFGEDQRAERREEIARLAVKRRTVMVVPLLLLIAPVMIIFVGAALPSLVLGPLR